MKLSKAAGVGLFFLAHSAVAQFGDAESKFNPESKYLFPIRPGTPGALAGTMGELRATHFHSGIDIRTNNEIGWPVLASKSGYISRAGVSGSGYGNVLYISHPDGTTTLYGHLEKFLGPVGDYILNERYRRKTSEIELFFRENQFKVKQGDTIALGGNTGSSGGPHLHFDIRKENKALDPLKFEFSEIKDILPPVIQKVAFKTLDINSRINDQFGRFEFYAVRTGPASYSLPAPILAHGSVGIELLGFDKVANTQFKCGINFIEVFADEVKIFSQNISEINLTEPRAIYGLIDFKAMRMKGSRFYKLYLDDANATLGFYNNSPTNGRIQINPEKNTAIKIVAKDIFGNASTITFNLKHSTPVPTVPFMEASKKAAAYDIQENTLAIYTQPCSISTPVIFTKGASASIKPAYRNTASEVYLFDLRKTIPDSIIVCGQSLKPNIADVVPAGTEYKYFSDRVDLSFSKGALLDTLYLNMDYEQASDSSEIFTIGNPLNPLGKSISVTLKPQRKYSTDKSFAVYRMVGKGLIYEGGKWVNGNLQFSPRELGRFTIEKDDIPPTIQVIYSTNQGAKFRIRDNLSGIAAFEATINGQWLLLNHDAKTATITTDRFNKKELLRGTLELTVTDNAGNKKTIKQQIQ